MVIIEHHQIPPTENSSDFFRIFSDGQRADSPPTTGENG
jgi:hypothetical protein